MKICILSTMYPRFKGDPRGLMVAEFNRLLLEEGHEVHVIAPGGKGIKSKEIMDGVHVHRFSYFFPKSLQKLAYGSGIPTNLKKSFLAKLQVPFFALAFVLKSFNIARKSDIIHCQWLPPVIIASIIKPFVRKPIVVTIRRVAKGKLMKPFTKFALKHVDLALYLSSYVKKECQQLAESKQSMVFPNSLNIDKFVPQDKMKMRKKLNLPTNKEIILYVGHLIEKKGVNYLIEALPEVFKRHPNTLMVIGGYGSDEDLLKQMVTQRNLQDKVIFTGKISSELTPSYFSAADIFVCPSIIDSKGDTETLGVVILEALACETPVVASRVGGIVDIMTPKIGLLSEPKKPGTIATALIKMLDNKEKREQMGKEGRKRVIEAFSAPVIKENIRKAYDMVLPNKPEPTSEE